MGIAQNRLMEERKQWRLDHPVGFFARPEKKCGEVNMMRWECGVPGQPNTLWSGGLYKVVLEFSADYPSRPPKCQFVPALFHPNVYPSGTICLSIINAEEGWKPAITVKQILLGIQELLDNPNTASPANGDAHEMYVKSRSSYDSKIKKIAANAAK